MMRAIAKRSAQNNDIGLVEVPVPKIDADEFLLRVHAIGVGIHDGYFHPEAITYPYTIGIEAAGVVEQKGSDVSRVEVGDRIALISVMQRKGGTWAEYAAVRGDSLLVPIPESMSFAEAAAIPVAGNTTLLVFRLLDRHRVRSLFIAGGSGAIGTFAIQMAVARGWRVGASASKGNHPYMTELGAEKVVDYREADWPQQIRQWMPEGVDAAIAIQPGTGQTSMAVVRDGGHIVTVSGDEFTPERGITVEQVFPQGDTLGELTELYEKVAAKEIRLVLEQVYPFEAGVAALEKTATRHARGKLALTLD